MLKKNEDSLTNQFASSISREIQPWPSKADPAVGDEPSGDIDTRSPSDLYTIVVANSQHPPMMQLKSWNLAVPFREQRFSHTPSESIANHYTPTATELKIKNLARKRKSLHSERIGWQSTHIHK